MSRSLNATVPRDEMSWWDWAVVFLHTAIEVEYALMIQYRYAANSLAQADFAGIDVAADAVNRTANWRTTIISVVREEMAHLLTAHNLPRFIGGPLRPMASIGLVP